MRSVSLLLTAICCLCFIAGCCIGRVRPGIHSSNERIRTRLLSHTPTGTNGTNALAFVVERLCHGSPLWAYPAYVDGLEAVAGHRLPVGRDTHRYVRVVLGEYPAGIFFSTLVTAEWQFDTADKLTNIVVERHTIGP